MKLDEFGTYKEIRKCTAGAPRKIEKLLKKKVIYRCKKGENERHPTPVMSTMCEVFFSEYSRSLFIHLILNGEYLTWNKERGWELCWPKKDDICLYTQEIEEIKFV